MASSSDKSLSGDVEDSANIQCYKRVFFWEEGTRALAAQITAINERTFVGLSKFWRAPEWSAGRWAPSKKGHLYLTLAQWNALLKLASKISTSAEALDKLYVTVDDDTGDNEDGDCDGVSNSTPAAVPAAPASGAGNVLQGPGLTVVSSDDSEHESEPAADGVDGVDGAAAAAAGIDEQAVAKQAQAAAQGAVAGGKRKRGRPAKNPGQPSTKPKKSKASSPAATAAAAPGVAAEKSVPERVEPVVLPGHADEPEML